MSTHVHRVRSMSRDVEDLELIENFGGGHHITTPVTVLQIIDRIEIGISFEPGFEPPPFLLTFRPSNTTNTDNADGSCR